MVVCGGVGLGFGVDGGGCSVELGAGADELLVVGCGFGALLVVPVPGLALVPAAVEERVAALWLLAPRLWLVRAVGLAVGLAPVRGVADDVELVVVAAA